MAILILGPILGLGPMVVLPISIVESLALTVLIAMLAERHLFPMPQD